MDLKGRFSVVAAAFLTAAILAFVSSTSSIIWGVQSKMAAAQALDEDGSLADKMTAIPVRAVRVIVASPYQRWNIQARRDAGGRTANWRGHPTLPTNHETIWNSDVLAALIAHLDNREARDAEVQMSDALIAPIFGLTLGGLFVAAHVLGALIF
jgi:hypothetical protein